MRRRHDRDRLASNPRLSRFGFAASLLAVLCQVLLVAALTPVPLALAADPLDGVPICHAETDGDSLPAPRKQDHPAHDCELCALCLSYAQPLAVLSSTPVLPERAFTARVLHDAWQARAPPVRLVSAAQPRGPPPLV